VPNPSSRGEDLIIFDLGEEALGPYKPPIANLSVFIVTQVLPYECQVMPQTRMEAKIVTSSGDNSIPFMTIPTGGVPPPNQLSLVQATMVSTISTLGSDLILSMVVITDPFTQNVIGPSFSYEMPGFGMSHVLSSSTL
jgi:hypothetical protein